MEPFLLEVTDIQPAAKDCVTIYLKRADGRPVDYRAGQFLTFLLTLNGRELRRSYSLSSAPVIDEFPCITVKRVTNGAVSRYLLDHLEIGDRLLTLPPSGRFTLDNAERIFFIAAGSGMVPILSLLKTALAETSPARADTTHGSGHAAGRNNLARGSDRSPEPRIVLISQQHDEESILFRQALEQWHSDPAYSFRWINLLTAPVHKSGSSGTHGSRREFRGVRLTNFLLEDILLELHATANPPDPVEIGPDPVKAGDKPLFYICGPPSFMRMAQFTLRLMGIEESRIRKEYFTVEYVPPPPLLADTLPKKITLLKDGQIIVFEAAYPMTILQAALAHRVVLPYSCRGGRCSTCVARCLKGKVKMSINEVLTDRDLKAGLVLTCVGYAQTDIELSFS
jgi:ring-1,2-phenylacetyl-CoA epoxidase subunit PaaE